MFLKIYEAQNIIVRVKKFMRENITKNWNAIRLTKFCVRNIANISNKVEKKENKKINASKLSN